KAIAQSVPMPVQCGGGLRSAQAIDAAFEAGARRVVIGTAAYDEDFLAPVLDAHGEGVAVAVDVRDGNVSAKGWTESTGLEAPAVVARLVEQGVRTVVYTDVDRDGLLSGPDVDTFAEIARAAGASRLIYSGGIGSLEHLETLAALGLANLDGVIVGKALYERRFTVYEAQEALADKVSVNSAAVARPQLIDELANVLGAQCVVLAIDAKRRADDDGWEVFVAGGRTATGRDAVEWASEGIERGAGEILLTSMD